MKAMRKALLAGVLAAATGVGTAMLDGDLETVEAIAALGAGLIAGAGTWAIPNARQPD